MTPANADDILHQARRAFDAVAKMARHVAIDEARLEALAIALPESAPPNVYDPDHHFLGEPEDTAAYIFALDAINFGSGYKFAMRDEGWDLIDGSIYYSVSTRLKNHFNRCGAITAAAMTKLYSSDVVDLLELPQGDASYEFAVLCARSLNELGGTVLNDADGSFTGMIGRAQGSAVNLVSRLAQLSCFDDVASYRGFDVPFLKRAQITAADLHLAFTRLGEPLFGDMHRLTMFADNAVPHVLRMDGVLAYDESLSSRIDAGELIAQGSEEEIEIRACAAHAVEVIADIKGMDAVSIDHLLWHRSVEDDRYKRLPAHRTRTMFY